MQLESVDSLWNACMTWPEHIVKCIVQISTHNTAKSFGQFGHIVSYSFTTYVVVGLRPIAVN